jgi:hypothetical protein
MRNGLDLIVLSLVAASAAGSACAMNSSAPQKIECHIKGGDKLPADSGGADALCKAIRDAAAKQVPGSSFTVDVHVLGRSALAATVTTAKGTKLPEQKMAISDRGLTAGSIERFANALVGEMARAQGR